MPKAYMFKGKFYAIPLPHQESCLQDRPNVPGNKSDFLKKSVIQVCTVITRSISDRSASGKKMFLSTVYCTVQH